MTDISATPPVIELAAPGHSLGISPMGAGFTHWRWQPASSTAPVDLLRPATAAAVGDPLALGCFPLVPYSNRIAGGEFAFDGRQIRLARNFGDHPHSIHGHGWQARWQVVGQGPAALSLRYDHAAGDWPFPYAAWLDVSLDPEGLSVVLRLRNDGAAAMPAGLGLHPYFPRAGSARLTANAAAVWLTDATMLPRERVALPPAWDLPAGCAVAGMDCDNVFTGWDGRARIDWKGLALEIEADPLLDHLVVYAPPGEDFFCIEPVSHMTDAFNRTAGGDPGTGMLVLAPGEEVRAGVVFRPHRLAA